MLYNWELMKFFFRSFGQIYLLFFFLSLIVSAQTSQIQLDLPLKNCWRLPDKIISAIQTSDSTAFFSLSDGTIEALDIPTAKIIWRSQYGGNLVSSPVSEKLVIANRISNNSKMEENIKKNLVIRLLSSNTGLTLLQRSFDLDSSYIMLLSNSSQIFLISDKRITALNKNDLNIQWENNLPSNPSSSLATNDFVFISSDNNLLVFSTRTGELIQKIQHKASIVGKMDFLGGVIFAGDETGKIIAYNLNKKKQLWQTITGASAVSIKAFEKRILVSSKDNFVYLLSSRNGNKIWKRRFPNRPVADLVIYDKFAIVEALDENKISILSLKTGEIVNQVELSSSPLTSPTIASGFLLIPTSKGLEAFANSCL